MEAHADIHPWRADRKVQHVCRKRCHGNRFACRGYERLILDAMRGDRTLFTSAEGIERLWEVSKPLVETPPPVRLYAQGPKLEPSFQLNQLGPASVKLQEEVWREMTRPDV